MLQRFVEELLARPSGPMGFRFILQPLMAIVFATKAGIVDARKGKPAYLWACFFDKAHRRDLLRDGWKDIARVFALAIVLDTTFQIFVLKGIRPLQTLAIGFALAILPYVLTRGPVNRISRATRHEGDDRSDRARRAA